MRLDPDGRWVHDEETRRSQGILWRTVKPGLIGVGLVVVLGFAAQIYSTQLLPPESVTAPAPTPQTTSRPTPGTKASRAPHDRELVFHNQRNGHFIVDGYADSVAMRFLVDTGASVVTLSQRDAAKLGVAGRLTYDAQVETANGVVAAARLTLRQLSVGPITLRNVEAVVLQSPLETSLLGMSFLRRLRSYRFESDRLVLAW